MEEVQVKLEEDALAAGAHRFRQRLEELAKEGDATAEGAPRNLLRRVLEPFEAALSEIAQSKDRRKYGLLVKWLDLVGPDIAAFLTLKVLLGNTRGDNVARLAPAIARLLHDEVRYKKLKADARGLFEFRMRSFNTSSYRHKSHSLNQTARYAGVEDEIMTDRDAMLLGLRLINVCIGATGIGTLTVETKKKGAKWSKAKTFALTAETAQLISDTNDILQFMRPQALPMVIPPLAWSAELNGGYHYGLRGKYGLIRKTSGKRARDVEMPFVYEGLNKIQDTKWRVNDRVLDVVQRLREAGSSLGGLPDGEPEMLPQKHDWMHNALPKEVQTDAQQVQLREWKKGASEVKARNNLRASRLIEWETAIQLAEQFRVYPAIYFPHNLDFRGRVYPICSGLQPQGSDLQRGLLQFGDAKPLGPEGAFWLAVHGANCLGEFDGNKFSKETFDNRYSWVRANDAAIRAVAEDPLQHTWWGDAEEPFQFLAFCFEWRDYLEAASRGAGSDHRSSLPVGQDGTCNGLQHFAALLRDSVGAREVNLTDEGSPRDVYDAIHQEVRSRLASEAVAGVAEAQWWLHSGLLSRSLFKRPTMTFAYGSKTFGMGRQLQESIMEEEVEDAGLKCRYLAVHIWAALETVVVAAFGGMEWFSECAGAIAVETGTVSWSVPVTNFPAKQEYWNVRQRRVKTILAGEIVKISTYHQTNKPIVSKHKNAIAPNVIHSLDAAALMMTVVLSSIEGLDAFSMVHDSYGTHACDIPKLAAATREAFIALYDGRDVSHQLYEQFAAQAEVPMPPAQGTFDVQQVRDSKYFFN